MFKLEFSTTNDSFAPGHYASEIEGILVYIAESVHEGLRDGPVRDSNGNTVGKWSLTEA
jgi:hypothetical protein